MSHNGLSTFNKYVTNRVLHNFARFSRGPFAVIRHVGRRSGKSYETTIMVEPLGDSFVIALTYGPEVDWYRNILAAGRCTLLWHGKEYTLEKPEPIAMQAALPAFSRLQRPILRLVGVQHFVSMKYEEGALAPATGEV
jgi:deazaflavin-dependent oxidoreductase (nitroreductase family)